MRFRQLNEVPIVKDVTDYFYGIDVRPKIDDGWMSDNYNIDSVNIPTLSSRACVWEGLDHRYGMKLGYFHDLIEVYDVTYTVFANKLKRIGGPENITEYDIKNLNSSEFHRRKLIGFGADIFVFPDMYVWEYAHTDVESIEYRMKAGSTPVEITMCTYEGTDITVSYEQSSQPQNPINGQYWMDTSKDGVLKRWNSSTSSWDTIATSYIKIKYPGSRLGYTFKDGMCINFYCENPSENNVTYTANGETKTGTVTQLLSDIHEKILVVVKASADYVILEGMLKHAKYTVVNACFENVVPWMDFAFEHGNRIWGCRFGVQKDASTHERNMGVKANEIFCSALGDYRTWYKYQGTTLDSFSATIGETGYFTGAGVVNGIPTFFKENAIISVYGSYPANFQVVTKKAPGIGDGCAKTLAVLDGKAFYQGANGIYMYDGSVPVKISDPIKKIKITTNNYGAASNGCYVLDGYASEYPDDDFKSTKITYIYDISKKVWNRIRLPKKGTINGMVSTSRNIVISSSSNGECYELFYDASRERKEIPLNWMLETGELALKSKSGGAFLEMKKYISQIIVRMNIPVDETVYFYLMYDDSGEWEHVYTADGGKLKSYTIPIQPRRCDHLRMKITGIGKADIYSIVKRIEMGSER